MERYPSQLHFFLNFQEMISRDYLASSESGRSESFEKRRLSIFALGSLVLVDFSSDDSHIRIPKLDNVINIGHEFAYRLLDCKVRTLVDLAFEPTLDSIWRT